MTIIVVDDHKMFRESVVSFLAGESFCEAVYSAGSVEEARQKISEHRPNIALVDLSFPGEGGTALAKWSRDTVPELSCIFLSMHEELSNLRAAIAAEGRGYVTKNAGYDELRAAITTVSGGGRYIDQVMLRKLFAFLSNQDASGEVPEVVTDLTGREREIFQMLIEDRSVSEIGDALFISTKTVENHRSNIYRKLGVHDRMSLFRFAESHWLVERSVEGVQLPRSE